MKNFNPNRHNAGTSQGGRFATGARSESSVTLHEPPTGDSRALAIDLVNAMAHSPRDWIAGDQDMAELYPHVPQRVISEDFLGPMVSAAWRGDDERVERLATELDEYGQREARWRADPTFEPPYLQDISPDDSHYPDRIGSKHTGWRDVAAIAKDVRGDIKAAVKAGYLPEATYSVTTQKYSGGQSLRVEVRGLSDETIYRDDYSASGTGPLYTERTALMRDRVASISQAYDRDRSDSMTDYFHNTYYAHTQVEDENAAAYREKYRADRARAAGRTARA